MLIVSPEYDRRIGGISSEAYEQSFKRQNLRTLSPNAKLLLSNFVSVVNIVKIILWQSTEGYL